jgi:hypothetical protein
MPRGKKGTGGNDAAGDGKPMSKMDGVRKTMAKLGATAKPLEIQAYLKKAFNIDMETTVISTYKNNVLKEMGKGKRGRRKKRGFHTAAAGSTSSARGITLDDIQTLKSLVDSMGAAKLLQLAKVLSK